MRSIWLMLLVFVCALGMMGVAQAQHYDDGYDYADLPFRPWSVHAGAGWFTGDLDDADDTTVTWIAGIEYAWRHQQDPCVINAATNNAWFLGVDYYPIDIDDDTVSVVPVILGYRWYGLATGYPIYFGAGIGARWVSDDVPALDMDSGVDFEWAAHAGIDFTPSVFGQFRFLAGTNPGDDGLFVAELGFRW